LGVSATKPGSQSFSLAYTYRLSLDDSDRLEEFIDRIGPLIPEKIAGYSQGKSDHLVISVQRYEDALLKKDIVESRISSAVMCLEALYLRRSERMELSRRFRQRIAKILSFFGHSPLDVYRHLTRAYEIRSDFVHGAPFLEEHREKATEIVDNVLEYARLSILLFLQLKKKHKKKKFIELIDRALLDPKASEKLSGIIHECCVIR
jgi:hypothetical protein